MNICTTSRNENRMLHGYQRWYRFDDNDLLHLQGHFYNDEGIGYVIHYFIEETIYHIQ